MLTEDYEKLSFFWKNCSREVAHSILCNSLDGTFLLRKSSDNSPCISLKHGDVYHFKILARLDGSIVIGDHNLFPSERYLHEELAALKLRLRFFDEQSNQTVLHLHTGLNKADFQDLSNYVTLYPDDADPSAANRRTSSTLSISFSQDMLKFQTALFGRGKWHEARVEFHQGNLKIDLKSKKEEITNKQLNSVQIIDDFQNKTKVLKIISAKKTVYLTSDSKESVNKLYGALKASLQ